MTLQSALVHDKVALLNYTVTTPSLIDSVARILAKNYLRKTIMKLGAIHDTIQLVPSNETALLSA